MHFEADGQACNDGTDWTGGDDLTHGGRYTTVRAISLPAPSRLRRGSVLALARIAPRDD
eukprot:COSAG04_NODE_407_length_14863_cov_24.011244_3_plen_59_part_00